MDLPQIDTTALKTVACEDCVHTKKTVVEDKVYCAKRAEHVSSARPICKLFELRKVVKETPVAINEPDPVVAVPIAAPTTVEVKGSYVYIGMELMGRVIGLEGRNIRRLEELTESTMEIHDSFIWVGSADPVKQYCAVAVLYSVFKYPNRSLHPSIIDCYMPRLDSISKQYSPRDIPRTFIDFLSTK